MTLTGLPVTAAWAVRKKALQRDAGDLLGRLEGQEHPGAGTHIGSLVGDILPAEEDLAAGDGVARVAHQGAHQGGLAGAVVAHQNMGLAGVHGKVQAIEKDFVFLPDSDL